MSKTIMQKNGRLTEHLCKIGFYVHPPEQPDSRAGPLLLGPFCGRPACQLIQTKPGKGVCADAFLKAETLLVGDVHLYPGHIGEPLQVRAYRNQADDFAFPFEACDALSASEIVVPLRSRADDVTVGVLDLDSTVKNTFDDEDRMGLERIVALLKL